MGRFPRASAPFYLKYMSKESRRWDKNPNIDREENMRSFGWRKNFHDEWSMDAYEFIKRNEEIRKSLSRHLFMDDIDIVLAPSLVLDHALRECLRIDAETQREK